MKKKKPVSAKPRLQMREAVYEDCDRRQVAALLLAVAENMGVHPVDLVELSQFTVPGNNGPNRTMARLMEAGLTPEDITPVNCHRASELQSQQKETFHQRWIEHNKDPRRPFNIVVAGDHRLSREQVLGRTFRGSDGADQMVQFRDGSITSAIVKQSVRATLFGYPMTAIIRWMGKEGWGFAQAKQAFLKLEIPVADATLRAQLRAGKKGERGNPAQLTEEQEEELRQASE